MSLSHTFVNMNQPEKSFYRVSIKALIFNAERKFLLLEQPNGYWDLPGGGLDYGEDYMACLTREIDEEVGGRIERVSPAPLLAYSTTNLRNMMVYNVIYDVALKDKELIPSDECISIRFVSSKEAATLNIVPGVKCFLELSSL